MNLVTSLSTITMCVALGAGVSMADEKCSCKNFPFKPDPPCFAQCTAVLLKWSDKSDLEKYLGLNSALANKISVANAKSQQPGEFLGALSTSEQHELRLQLKRLDQSKVDHLSESLPKDSTTHNGVDKQYEAWAVAGQTVYKVQEERKQDQQF